MESEVLKKPDQQADDLIAGFVQRVREEATRLTRRYKLSSAAATQEAFNNLAASVERVNRQPQEDSPLPPDHVWEGPCGCDHCKPYPAASVSHQPQPYTYGDQLLRCCEPGTRKGHFFIDGAPKCQCNTEAAPIAPVVVNSQQEPPKEQK